MASELSTSFATPRGELRAVDGVSLQLDRGETLGIVGESGSGKSMLVRTIMGLQSSSASTSGRIVYDGQDLAGLSPAARRKLWGPELAMIFQDPTTSLNPVKRVGTHITESLRAHLGMSRKAAKQRALDLLEQVGIPDPARRLRQYPHELSGGMRQRVTIAVALACEPNLLVADEPTTALDVTVQKQILDLLSLLQQERHMAMILITHDLGVVSGRASRVAVMYAGRVVETAPTRRLFASVRHPYTEALLRCSPRIDTPSHTRLQAIEGRPPDLATPPPGCRFAPRCAHATEKCRKDEPPLQETEDRHLVACHHPVEVVDRGLEERAKRGAVGLAPQPATAGAA